MVVAVAAAVIVAESISETARAVRIGTTATTGKAPEAVEIGTAPAGITVWIVEIGTGAAAAEGTPETGEAWATALKKRISKLPK